MLYEFALYLGDDFFLQCVYLISTTDLHHLGCAACIHRLYPSIHRLPLANRSHLLHLLRACLHHKIRLVRLSHLMKRIQSSMPQFLIIRMHLLIQRIQLFLLYQRSYHARPPILLLHGLLDMLNKRLLEEALGVDVCELLEELGSYYEDVVLLAGLPIGLDEDFSVGVVGEQLYRGDGVAAESVLYPHWLEEGY